MPRSSNQKLKLLHLAQILARETDEAHPLTVPQLIEALDTLGIHAERKSIYDDLAVLTQCGLDIQYRKGRSPGWFLSKRFFSLEELKLLTDTVNCSGFLSPTQRKTLLDGLRQLASIHQTGQLNRPVQCTNCGVLPPAHLYTNLDRIHTALTQDHAIMFRPITGNASGNRRTVFPLGLVWNGAHYFLIAWDRERGALCSQRADQMSEVVVTCLSRPPEAPHSDFDLATYAQTHDLDTPGTPCPIVLRGHTRMAEAVLEQFGADTELTPSGPEHFTAAVTADLTPRFFGWLASRSDGLTLSGPPRAVQAYRTMLAAALDGTRGTPSE